MFFNNWWLFWNDFLIMILIFLIFVLVCWYNFINFLVVCLLVKKLLIINILLVLDKNFFEMEIWFVICFVNE